MPTGPSVHLSSCSSLRAQKSTHMLMAKLRPQTFLWNPPQQGELGSDGRCLQEALHLSKWEGRASICGPTKTAKRNNRWTVKKWWSILSLEGSELPQFLSQGSSHTALPVFPLLGCMENPTVFLCIEEVFTAHTGQCTFLLQVPLLDSPSCFELSTHLAELRFLFSF